LPWPPHLVNCWLFTLVGPWLKNTKVVSPTHHCAPLPPLESPSFSLFRQLLPPLPNMKITSLLARVGSHRCFFCPLSRPATGLINFKDFMKPPLPLIMPRFPSKALLKVSLAFRLFGGELTLQVSSSFFEATPKHYMPLFFYHQLPVKFSEDLIQEQFLKVDITLLFSIICSLESEPQMDWNILFGL